MKEIGWGSKSTHIMMKINQSVNQSNRRASTALSLSKLDVNTHVNPLDIILLSSNALYVSLPVGYVPPVVMLILIPFNPTGVVHCIRQRWNPAEDRYH